MPSGIPGLGVVGACEIGGDGRILYPLASKAHVGGDRDFAEWWVFAIWNEVRNMMEIVLQMAA